MAKHKNPLWKVVAIDITGVCCLLLVPIIGPLPGPGGIPLLIAGFGLLAINHDWADDAVKYVKSRSQSFRNIIFPDITWVKWSWDVFALLLLISGTWLNVVATHWFWGAAGIATIACATTIFMMNRDRISKLDKALRHYGKK